MESLSEFMSKYTGPAPVDRPDSVDGLLSRYPVQRPNVTTATEEFLKKYPHPEQSELAQQFPKAAGFLKGVAGSAPDELEGSVLDQNHLDQVEGAKLGAPIGVALGVAPGVGAIAGGLKAIAKAPSVVAGGRAAQRGYLRGTMAEGADEGMGPRFRARNEINAHKQWTMEADPENKWFQGKDGKWRNEVSDDKAEELVTSRFDVDLVIANKKPVTMLLTDALKHEKLFADYPDLRDYTVVLNPNIPKTHAGQHDVTKRIIELNPEILKDKALTRNTLLHEAQHAVDSVEGVQAGADLGELTKLHGRKAGTDLYYKAAGEASARSQEARSRMTSAERAQRGFPLGIEDTGELYKDLKWNLGPMVDGPVR